MIQATQIRNAKMFYNNYKNSTVVKIEIDNSVYFVTEITVSEAKQLRDELNEIIDNIVGEESE